MFYHQLANAVVSFCVSCAVFANEQDKIIGPLGVWCAIDFFLIVFLTEDGARKQSLLVHHVFMGATCAMFVTESVSVREAATRITKILCLFEVSTVFVCLYNCFPQRRFLRIARDATFATVRGLGGALVLWDQHVFAARFRLRHRACLTAIIALSIAWMAGKSLVGRNASLIAYAVSFATARRVVGSAQHAAFVLLGATGSFFFYEHGETKMDRSVVTGHALYRFLVVLDEESWLLFFIAAFFAYGFHGWAPDAVSRDINNSLIPLLALRLTISKGICSVELVTGLVAMAAYLMHGGPRRLSFGHRIAWHTASNCVISELMN